MATTAQVADPGGAARVRAGWEAQLSLRFERAGERTVLAARRHAGPLRVQKPLYPEGDAVCQAVVVHPPGGIVGGDSLCLDVDAGARTYAQLTTPGAAKWYRAPQEAASWRTSLRVGEGACVEWLPHEAVLFDGARATVGLRIELAGGARFVGWDITHLGRTAAGERFASGWLRQAIDVCRDGTPLYCERTVLEGGSRSLHSGAVLARMPAFGTMLATGVDVSDAMMAACRAAVPRTLCAVTRLPQVLIARWRGESGVEARTHFANLWRVLRPAFGAREALIPRIWST